MLRIFSRKVGRKIRGYKNKIKRIINRKKVLGSVSNKSIELASKIRSEKLTYVTELGLASLASTCRSIEKEGLPGVFIEAGCALGGSAIVIASHKHRDRPLLVYDVFGMIPSPTVEDSKDVHDRYESIVSGKSRGLGGDTYYGYIDDLYDVVQSNFVRYGLRLEEQSISLIKGLVQDTMVINEPVALAHIDVDWYDPVKTCLERIYPNLTIGGSIILDDYNIWDGCRKAADEYLETVRGGFLLDDFAGSMKITKIQ